MRAWRNSRTQLIRTGAAAFLLCLLAGAAPQVKIDQPQAVTVVVGPNGRLIVVPVDGTQVREELPIVSNGFASDQDVKGPLTPLIGALGSPTYQEREQASAMLCRLPPARLPEVATAVRAATDDEVIERLTEVAAHLYLKPRTYLKVRSSLLGIWFKSSDPSLLGIKFALEPVRLRPTDGDKTMTVLVAQLQPGFPAWQILRNGDRIVAIGGVGFTSGTVDTEFRLMVAQLWPGSIVPMTILRDGKLVELAVQTTGLPVSSGGIPEIMVDQRMTALAGFLQDLKKSPTAGVQ